MQWRIEMANRLILDHLTVADAAPRAVISAAARARFDGVGLFLHAMPEVPGMADFDLVGDPRARRDCRHAAEDAGCTIAIAYPFTIGRTSMVSDYALSLDAAADVGARAINLLVFDRDIARQIDMTAALCARAAGLGLEVGLEFFPVSAVATLVDALALIKAVDAINLKLTVDLLHLHRSGSSLDLLSCHRDRILLAQLCDAPDTPPADLFDEAAAGRLLPGEGALDVAGFLDACGTDATISVEAPNRGSLSSSLDQRARSAHRAILDHAPMSRRHA